MQKRSYVFDGLLYEMVSKEIFISQKIGYINDTGEIETYTVVDYITKYLSKKAIEKKNIIYVKGEDTN